MSQFRARQVGAAVAIAERARNESGAALVREEDNEERKEGGFFTRRRRLTSPSFTENGTRDEEQTSSSTIQVKNHKKPGTMRTLTFRSAKTAKADGATENDDEEEEYEMALDRKEELGVLMEDSFDDLLGENNDHHAKRSQPYMRRTKTSAAATRNDTNTTSDDASYGKEFQRSKSQMNSRSDFDFVDSFLDDGYEYGNKMKIERTQTKASRYQLPNPENTWYPSLDIVNKAFKNVLNEVAKKVTKSDTRIGKDSSGVRKKQVKLTMDVLNIESKRRHNDSNVRMDDSGWVRGTRFFEFSQTRFFSRWIATMVFLYVLSEGIDNWNGITTVKEVGGWRLAFFNAVQIMINITFLIEATIKIGGAGPVVRVTHSEMVYNDDLKEAVEKTEVTYRLARWEPWSYFFNLGNIYDFTVNILIIYGYLIDAMPGLDDGWFNPGRITAFRLLRMIRVLKFFYSFRSFSVILSGIAAGIKGMGWVVILLLVVMYVYAVLGATLFSVNDPMHFRDLSTSFLSAANIATMNDWRTYLLTTMYGCEHFGYTEDDYLDKCPYLLADDGETKVYAPGQPLVAGIYFISMILIIGNIMMSLVIGIITAKMDEANERVDKLRNEKKKFASRTVGAIWKSRKALDDALPLYQYNKVMSYLHLFSGKMDDEEKDQFGTPDSRMVQIQSWMARNIVDTKWFESLIMLAILASAVLSGYSTKFMGYSDDHETQKDYPSWIRDVESTFIYLFLFEVSIKFIVYWDPPVMTFFTGRQKFWNIFDLVTVMVGLAGEIAERAFDQAQSLSSFTRVVRALRLARLVKVMRMVPQLNIIIQSLALGMLSLIYVLVLMMFVFYAYSIIGVVLFSLNDPFNFRTVPVSAVTLFQLSMLEDWTNVLWVNMFGCNVDKFGVKDNGFFYHNLQEMEEEPPYPCDNPKENRITAFVYFFSFVIINALVFVSVFIGVIVNGMQEATASMIGQINLKRRIDAIREHFDVGIQKKHDLEETYHLMNWEGHKKMNLSHVEELLTKVQVEHKPGYLRRVIQVWSAQNRNANAHKIATKFHNTRWENTVYNLKEGKFQKLRSIRGEGKNTIQLSPRRTDDNAVRSPYHISFSESLEQQIQDDDESERSKIAIDFPDFVLLVCLLEQAEFLEKSYFLHPLSGKDGAESDSYDDSESGSDFEKERDGEEEEDHEEDHEDEEKQRKIELTKEESVRMRLKAYRLGLRRSLKRVAHASASIGHRANAASHALRKLRLLAKRFRMRAENRLMNVQEKLFEGSNRVIGEIKI
jgi:voltage-gated sodium channel